MREGWLEGDYLIVFSEDEVTAATCRYDLASMLPGFAVLGLVGWDDFIVRDERGEVFKVPTVPCVREYLEPYVRHAVGQLAPDPRYAGKVKWYVKPIVFGGDPMDESNRVWVSPDEHAQIVRWWNDKYRSMSSSKRDR